MTTLTHLPQVFLSVFKPNQNQLVDESMIKFKCRCSIKQYMPQKSIKRGYKVWMRCDENCYVCQFELYCGKNGDNVKKGLGERVMKSLCKEVFGKNHKVFFDNFIQFALLFENTKCVCLWYCYDEQEKSTEIDKNLHREDMDWAVSNVDIVCLRWKDKRVVALLSTLENPVDVVSISRKEKNGDKNKYLVHKLLLPITRKWVL